MGEKRMKHNIKRQHNEKLNLVWLLCKASSDSLNPSRSQFSDPFQDPSSWILLEDLEVESRFLPLMSGRQVCVTWHVCFSSCESRGLVKSSWMLRAVHCALLRWCAELVHDLLLLNTHSLNYSTV